MFKIKYIGLYIYWLINQVNFNTLFNVTWLLKQIKLDTWFNFFGTLVGAGIGGWVAYYIATIQVEAHKEEQEIERKEQAKQQKEELQDQWDLQDTKLQEQANTQKTYLENQIKSNIERDKKIISDRFKLETYLKLFNLLKEFRKEAFALYELADNYDSKVTDKSTYFNDLKKITEHIIPNLEKEIEGLIMIVPKIKKSYYEILEYYGHLAYIIEHRLPEEREKFDIAVAELGDSDEDFIKRNMLFQEIQGSTYKEIIKYHEKNTNSTELLMEKIVGYINEIIDTDEADEDKD